MSKNLFRIALIAAGAIATSLFLWRRYGPSTYKRFKTMFGATRVFQVLDDEGRPVRLLEVDGVVQSGTYLDDRYTELVFEYLKLYDLMFKSDREIKHVCVLGCGGYDYPEHLVAHHPEVTVDAIEIDPMITSIARRYFFLDRAIEEFDAEEPHRLNLICADALAHLKGTNNMYDAIVNDVFDAGKPPAHLTTTEFLQAVHDRLAPDGLYLTNIVSTLEGPGSAFLKDQVSKIESVFGNARVLPCANDNFSDEDNVIVIASKRTR